MAHYRTTVSSPAPAGEIFTYLADFATVAEWDPGIARARLLSGESGAVGARYEVVARFFGLNFPLEYTILESDPPTVARPGRVALEAMSSDVRSHDVITVTPEGAGCSVTYEADLALQGFRRPFDPFLSLAFRVIADRASAGLAEAVKIRRAA